MDQIYKSSWCKGNPKNILTSKTWIWPWRRYFYDEGFWLLEWKEVELFPIKLRALYQTFKNWAHKHTQGRMSMKSVRHAPTILGVGCYIWLLETKRLLKRSRGIMATTIQAENVLNSFRHMKKMPLLANARDNSSTSPVVFTMWGDGNNIEGREGQQGVGCGARSLSFTRLVVDWCLVFYC